MSTFSGMEMVPGIKTLLDTCAALKSGEKVLIITDTGMDPAVITAFESMCADRGAEVVTTKMTEVSVPGQAPPSMVAAAAKEANLVLELSQQFIASSQARIDACKAGARWLCCCAMTPSILTKEGAANADYHKMVPLGQLLAEKFSAAKTYRLLNQKGTDLSGSIDGRPGRFLSGLATTPGSFAGPPDIECGTAPVEGTSNGIAVVDVLLLMKPYETLADPVRVTFENGMAVAIEGPRAFILKDMIDRCNDANMTNLAEVSLGLNPLSRVSGVPLESESALGAVHIALGNNLGYFGHTYAAAHLDLVIPEVTFYLDDECIVKDGKYLVGEGLF